MQLLIDLLWHVSGRYNGTLPHTTQYIMYIQRMMNTINSDDVYGLLAFLP